MAEHWKSTPRIWCKQCKIFIRDTGFEKSQHEASAKHQGNLKRFLRDIHRDNERQQRESDKAKNEVSRLRQTVAGGSSAARDHAPRAPVPEPKPAQRPASLDERKKQIAQLADMGVAVPEEFRRDMALAGEWQTVSRKVVSSEGVDADGAGKAGASVGVRKRKHEGEEEEEEEDVEIKTSVSKPWGSRFRDYPVAEAQDEGDLDELLESTKDLKKSVVKKGAADESPTEGDTVKRDEDAESKELGQSSNLKDEKPAFGAEAPPTTSETAEAAPGVVFKKRKAKVMKK